MFSLTIKVLEQVTNSVSIVLLSVDSLQQCISSNPISHFFQVKINVRSSISRQMESLRNREVWLLDQVDLLQQTKDELLRRQEDRLQRSLGGLQGSLVYCQDDSVVKHGLGPGLKRKLSESLEKYEQQQKCFYFQPLTIWFI